MSCRGCIAVSSLPKSQFLIASNSSEPPSTTFSHPGVSEEKEEKSFLFHQKPCLRLFWSRLDDWLSLFCFGSHFSQHQLTNSPSHQLSSSPAGQGGRLASQPGNSSNKVAAVIFWRPAHFTGVRHVYKRGSPSHHHVYKRLRPPTRPLSQPGSHSQVE